MERHGVNGMDFSPLLLTRMEYLNNIQSNIFRESYHEPKVPRDTCTVDTILDLCVDIVKIETHRKQVHNWLPYTLLRHTCWKSNVGISRGEEGRPPWYLCDSGTLYHTFPRIYWLWHSVVWSGPDEYKDNDGLFLFWDRLNSVITKPQSQYRRLDINLIMCTCVYFGSPPKILCSTPEHKPVQSRWSPLSSQRWVGDEFSKPRGQTTNRRNPENRVRWTECTGCVSHPTGYGDLGPGFRRLLQTHGTEGRVKQDVRVKLN